MFSSENLTKDWDAESRKQVLQSSAACNLGKSPLGLYFHKESILSTVLTKRNRDYISLQSSTCLISTNTCKIKLEHLNVFRAVYVQFRTVNTVIQYQLYRTGLDTSVKN